VPRREVLDLGAITNHVEAGGWSALLFAAANGREDMVRVLLDHHADVYVTSDDGQTPLSEALAYATIDPDVSARVVAMLEEYMAKYPKLDNDGSFTTSQEDDSEVLRAASSSSGSGSGSGSAEDKNEVKVDSKEEKSKEPKKKFFGLF
jgi:hypothetical protein